MRRSLLEALMRSPAGSGAVAFVVGATAVVATLPFRSATAAVTPIALKGGGAATLSQDLPTWQNDLFAGPSPVDMNYIATGSGEAWVQSAVSSWDFIISGTEPSTADLDGRSFISAPVSATALVPMMSQPAATGSGFIGWGTRTTIIHVPTDGPQWAACPDINDPNYGGVPECIEDTTAPFTQPLRIPAENLVAMALNLPPEFNNNGLANWSSPAIAQAMNQGPLPTSWSKAAVRPAGLMRTERSSTNYYFQLYAKQMAPTAWSLIQAAYPAAHYEPVTDHLPRGLTRSGLDASISLPLLSNGSIDGSVVNNFSWASNLVLVPVGWVANTLDLYTALSDPRLVQVQNAAGEYLDATSATIQAALDAGGAEGNYAATHNVPGAYPLVWLNKLYAPSTGLTVDKTNAVAATIRYLATAGQAAVTQHGSASLTPTLVAQAVAAADELVASNCVGADRSVEIGPATLYGSDNAAVAALGDVSWCAVKVAPPPTTTTTVADTTTVAATTTTTTTVASTTTPASAPPPPTTSSPFVPSAAPPAARVTTTVTTSPPETVPVETTTTTIAEALPPATTAPPPTAPPAKASLPYELPSDGRGNFQSLGTFSMGAGVFLIVRRSYLRRVLAGT